MNIIKALTKAKFVRSLFAFSIPTWINFGISLVSAFILTRLFAPTDYGYISIFTSSTEFGMAVMCLGMDSGCLRFYNTPPNNESKKLMMRKVLSISFTLITLFSLIVCVGFPKLFSIAVFGVEDKVLCVLLCLNILCSVIFRFFGIMYRMEMNAKHYSMQTILTNLVRKLGYVAAVLISPDFKTAITLQVLLLTIAAIIYTYKSRAVIDWGGVKIGSPRNSLAGYGSFIKYSLLSAPEYAIGYAYTMIILQMLRILSGPESAGIFSAASYFSTALAVLRGGFGTFWAPYMYKNYETKQKEIQLVHDIWMLFSAVCFAGLILFRDVIFLLIGPEYNSGKEIVAFLMLGSILQAALETTVYGVYIKQKNQITLIVHIVQVLVCLMLCYLLIPNLGIAGAAIAFLASNLVNFILCTYYGQKFYRSITSYVRTSIVVLILLLECALVFVFNMGVISYISVVLCTVVIIVIFIPKIKQALGLIKLNQSEKEECEHV